MIIKNAIMLCNKEKSFGGSSIIWIKTLSMSEKLIFIISIIEIYHGKTFSLLQISSTIHLCGLLLCDIIINTERKDPVRKK